MMLNYKVKGLILTFSISIRLSALLGSDINKSGLKYNYLTNTSEDGS